MDDDLVSSVQDALQHLFKKPKLSAKLLGKPPFRFLHDVVMAVSSATGFASTLYTDEEKDSGNYKDKAGKIDFLQKMMVRLQQPIIQIITSDMQIGIIVMPAAHVIHYRTP